MRLQIRHANNIELNDDTTTTQKYEDIIKTAIGTYYLVYWLSSELYSNSLKISSSFLTQLSLLNWLSTSKEICTSSPTSILYWEGRNYRYTVLKIILDQFCL